MKTLFLECNMGAAGDMLLGALLELAPDPQGVLDKLNRIPGVTAQAEKRATCGITGTHVTILVRGEEEHSHDVMPESSAIPVHIHGETHSHPDHSHTDHDHPNHHHHAGLADIAHIVEHLEVPERVKAQVLSVYHLIAQAEGNAHGKPVEEIHFHEVGAMDAVADVLGVCLLMEQLGAVQVIVGPVHTGYGQVLCTHGVLPVPAPATAWLLQGIPSTAGYVEGELCTPTGAALLRHFATGFGGMPVMTVEKIGYGVGTKEFHAANCVRAFFGDTAAEADDILELKCNLDDMTGEAIGYTFDRLLDAGALDVFSTAVQMKKNRPGVLLTVLCRPGDRARLTALLLRETTTIGVRETGCRRTVLARRDGQVETAFGTIGVKRSQGNGVLRVKPEYDDVAKAAKARDVPFAEVLHAAQQAGELWREQNGG